MDKVTNIAKNTSYFTFALVLQKVISFSYFTILARTLVPEDLGKYYFAISFTAIFAIFIDLGLSNVLTREVAKMSSQASHYLSSIIALKIPLAITSFLSVLVLVNLLGYPELTRQLVYLSSLCMVLDSFSTTFFACLRGFHNLKYESLASVLFQASVFIFGLSALYYGLDLRALVLALVLASTVNFIFAIFLIKFKRRLKLLAEFDLELLKVIVRVAIPFAIFGILQKFYMYFDTVLLSLLAGDKYVGLYQISFKIVFALQFLPMAFIASLYPAFARYWKENREQLAITFERALNYLLIMAIPISIGIVVLADKIIQLFKPEYVEAVPSLRIIMVALVFMFLNFPIGSLLNACDKQKINTRNMAITATTSILLNLIFISRWQATGASLTVLITGALMFLLGLTEARKIIKINFRQLALVFLKIIISALAMAGLVYVLQESLNIFLVVLIGGLAYLGLLLIFQAFKKEDIISILNSFKKNQSIS